MIKSTKLKHEDVIKRLNYNPLTGELRWTHSLDNSNSAKGKIAGSLYSHGSFVVLISGERWTAQQLIYFIMTGDVPQGRVANINKNTEDNRWGNLEYKPAKNKGIKGIHARGSSGGFKVAVNGEIVCYRANFEDAVKELKRLTEEAKE